MPIPTKRKNNAECGVRSAEFIPYENSAFRILHSAFLTSILFLLSLSCFAAPRGVETPEDKILSQAFQAYMDGKDKLALSYFEEVIRINPKNQAAKRGLEKTKDRMKKADSVEKAKARVLAKAKFKEGEELEKTGDIVAAIDSYHAAIDAIPTFKRPQKKLKAIKARMSKFGGDSKRLNLSQIAFARGVLAYLDRDWAKAYRIWSERYQIEPQNVSLANATARAEASFRKMMLSEQEDFFRRGARAFYEQGLYLQAKNSWSRVVALRPDDQEGLEGMARSEEALLRAIGKGRNNQIHDLLEEGLGHYAQQNWHKALNAFQRLTQLDPDFSTAKEYVAKINKILNANEYQPAAVASKSWRDTRPSAQGSTTVQVPDKLENFVERRNELDSQLKRDPSNLRIQQELDNVIRAQEEESERIYKDGLIAYSQGNRAMAIQQWKQVLIIHPEHKKAQAALRKAMAEEERTDKETVEQ